jgi:hypothetical protein
MTYGLWVAARSPLFLVQVVEIGGLPENPPVDGAEITRLANVPVGRVSLFQLDLSRIEKNIRSNAWIREARIQKRFPQTVFITVNFRQPRAMIENAQGTLSYVDSDGTVFGRVSTRALTDSKSYPLLAKLPDAAHVGQALKFLDSWNKWNKKTKAAGNELSSLSWDDERGYRAIVTYPLKIHDAAPGAKSTVRGRARVDLGQNIDVSEVMDPQLDRLGRVLDYLSVQSIAARQIWADSGKKIVVRTARGS